MRVPRVQQHKYKNVCTPTKHKTDAVRRLVRTKFRQWQDDGRRTAVLLLGLKLRCLHRTGHVWKDQSSHVREPRTVLDSGFHARNSFRIPGNYSRSMSVELGFRIPIFSGIPNPRFRFLGQNFRGFRIPNAKICRIPEFITWGETMPYSIRKTVTILKLPVLVPMLAWHQFSFVCLCLYLCVQAIFYQRLNENSERSRLGTYHTDDCEARPVVKRTYGLFHHSAELRKN